jgi:hypothetical protein
LNRIEIGFGELAQHSVVFTDDMEPNNLPNKGKQQIRRVRGKKMNEKTDLFEQPDGVLVSEALMSGILTNRSKTITDKLVNLTEIEI